MESCIPGNGEVLMIGNEVVIAELVVLHDRNPYNSARLKKNDVGGISREFRWRVDTNLRQQNVELQQGREWQPAEV